MGRRRASSRRLSRAAAFAIGLTIGLSAAAPASASRAAEAARPRHAALRSHGVKTITIHYRAHNGARRSATVLLPAGYGPKNNPRIPLVISPHGRGVSGRANARLWGALPTRGSFAVINPDGQGRKLPRHSWGYSGQIDDLARMPVILERTLPWVRVDFSRIYAVGGSMGGQETLLLVARYPKLLAGAAVFDAVVDLTLQYRRFPQLACNRRCRRTWTEPMGDGLQDLAREEIGGTPKKRPMAYRIRSPFTYAHAIAFSCVPLQIWWSVADRVVTPIDRQSARLFWKIRQLNPKAPVEAYVGFWIHTAALRAKARLPIVLVGFELLHEPIDLFPARLRMVLPPPESIWCAANRG